jgi:hypothetical protein
MGILDLFKRNGKSNVEKVEMPNELKHLISRVDFDSILTFATTYLRNKGHINITQADGLLIYETSGEDGTRNQTNFMNLVKSVICEERKDWKIKTCEYLENLTKDKELENEILLNFEEAKEYLTVRLQPASSYEDEPYRSHVETLVYKVDIPETYSLLALDLPSRFHILTIEEINAWGLDRINLFEIAHNNILDKIENIQVRKHDWDGAVFYTLFDRDYSASYCVDFANSCNNLFGEKGALVSFPTRGSVFVHPITEKEQFNIAYNHIAEKTNKFFDDDPGPISRNIYWFNENKFTLFNLTKNNGELTYNIPQQLYDLINS